MKTIKKISWMLALLVVNHVSAQKKPIAETNSPKDSTTVLKEVNIGPMGIRRTKDATVSSQKQISHNELNSASNPNIAQALTAKVSGLQVNTISNGVNAETRIVLRGNRSVTGNNQALIVIDNAISSSDILNQLPPELVDSINVIKGAQGAALYGDQGVNGVLIVTTKKGYNNKTEEQETEESTKSSEEPKTEEENKN